MTDKIKKAIEDYRVKYSIGIPATDGDYYTLVKEILVDAKDVYHEIGAFHRWYDELFRVVNIEGVLIGFDWFHVTGDTSISDMDLDFDIDSVCEVEEKQRTETYYIKIK